MPNGNGKTEKHDDWGMACSVCHAHNPRFYMLRWILGLLILAMTLFVGVKLGELKAYLGDGGTYGGGYGFHRGMMYNNGSYFYPPMMYNYNQQAPTTTTPPTNSTSKK